MSDARPALAHARCYCGSVTLRAPALAQPVIHCHCGQCRRLSGAAFTTWVSLSRHGMQLRGEDRLAMFAATPNATRHFCRRCGTHVFTLDIRYPDVAGVPAGIIDGELPTSPAAHYFVSHRAAWHGIDDALPRFGGPSGFEPVPAPHAGKIGPGDPAGE